MKRCFWIPLFCRVDISNRFKSLAPSLEKVRQTSVWQTFPKFWFFWLWYISFCITYKSKSLRNNKKRQINQNFWTVCHTEVYLTFSRLGAKLSGTIAKFWGRSLKIQHGSSFDLNNLKNGPSLHFKSSLKSMHLIQRLMWAMNCR